MGRDGATPPPREPARANRPAGGAGASLPLSPQPPLDRALATLLEASIAPLLEAARPLRPRLLLVMGSAACGEATGVSLPDGRWLALSDLDLALIVEEAPDAARRERLRAGLASSLAPELARLGLVADPVDLGIYARRALAELPATIEVAEARERPRALWGDAALLAEAPLRFEARFEALRLITNRIVEAGFGVPGPLSLPEPRAPHWPAEPQAEDWRSAHRFSKLPIDAAKAWLVAEGILEPSLAARAARLREGGDPLRARKAALDAAAPGWGEVLEAWSRWRLAPAWPPPEADLSATGAFLGAALRSLLDALAGEAFRVGEESHWRRVLAAERGSSRERQRRWRRLVASRPREVSLARALGLWLHWSRVWPASLGGLAGSLAWIEALERGRGGSGAPAAARLARALPLCEDLRSDVLGPAGARGLERVVAWLRAVRG